MLQNGERGLQGMRQVADCVTDTAQALGVMPSQTVHGVEHRLHLAWCLCAQAGGFATFDLAAGGDGVLQGRQAAQQQTPLQQQQQ